MFHDVTPPDGPRQDQEDQPPKPFESTEFIVRPNRPEAGSAEDTDFKSPEEIAAQEESSAPTVVEMPGLPPEEEPPKRRWVPHGRKQWAILAVVAVLVLGGGGTAAWKLTRTTPPPPPPAPKKVVAKKPPAPTVIYSTLSGLPISDASINSKPVTAVMVENSLAARPQSGLSQAGVVFEAVAEGGVTRYMALYQDTAPTNVGPIRSARPYYEQWALGFDAAYAHVGGSVDGLRDIKTWGVQDMNQFYNGAYYHRITSRYAPHNVYTGIPTLNQLEAKKGYKSTYTGFPRADKQAPLAQPTATSISMTLSGPYYDPHFAYDASTNTYKRSIDGAVQTDANTGKPIAPTVVVAMVVPLKRGALDSTGAYYSDYNPIGSGTVYIFQNGGVVTGQWHKASNTAQLTFTDATGKAIPLDRGQTWITAIAGPNKVTYK